MKITKPKTVCTLLALMLALMLAIGCDTTSGNNSNDNSNNDDSLTPPPPSSTLEDGTYGYLTIENGVVIKCDTSATGDIAIPDSVTSIGESAFSSCTSLESVNYNGSKGEWYKIKFDGYTGTGLSGKTIIGKDGETWTHTGN